MVIALQVTRDLKLDVQFDPLVPWTSCCDQRYRHCDQPPNNIDGTALRRCDLRAELPHWAILRPLTDQSQSITELKSGRSTSAFLWPFFFATTTQECPRRLAGVCSGLGGSEPSQRGSYADPHKNPSYLVDGASRIVPPSTMGYCLRSLTVGYSNRTWQIQFLHRSA